MSASNSGLRVRRSLYDLQDAYEAGDTTPLDKLMLAWQGIKALKPDNPNSFFMIGGYHGAPFRGGGISATQFWGGYCNHGNVLFPTWHRMYLHRLESALQSIDGCADVMLPFWDETDPRTLKNGIPWALTDEFYKLRKSEKKEDRIDNPLRSFKLPRKLNNDLVYKSRPNDPNNPNYSKPEGYETVRYPLSGLVGTDLDKALTEMHNRKYPDYATNVTLLNQNVRYWLAETAVIGGRTYRPDVAKLFQKCLDAPNYTLFSNTTSASYYNDFHPDADSSVIPLEKPHNSMHIAIGGFTPAGSLAPGEYSPLGGANGDMGENDTAGLDPIFHFHHCFIDRMFWLWQQRNDATDELEVIDGYPGTNTSDLQGPTPGFPPNTWLNLDTPLNPFRNEETGEPYTSWDCINIERQLNYTYGPGSLDDVFRTQDAFGPPTARTVRVSGIDRSEVRGSFVVNAFAIIDGRREHVGTEAVLSRWNVNGCANCQTHLGVQAFIDMPAELAERAEARVELAVEMNTKGDQINQVALAGSGHVPESQPFQIDVQG